MESVHRCDGPGRRGGRHLQRHDYPLGVVGMESPKRPVIPVHRGRRVWAPMTVAAATVIGVVIGPLAPAASATGSAPTATVQLAGTARSAIPRSASDPVTGPGSVGVRLLDVPTDAVTNPRAREYIVDNLAPGTTIHRRIVVSNTTTSAQHVAVYPAAATITRSSFVGAAAHTANDLSTWTTVSRPSLDVPAGATAVDTVTVVIPPTASPGERYAVVWAEVSNVQNGGNIDLVNR